jgi:hypothetical protein
VCCGSVELGVMWTACLKSSNIKHMKGKNVWCKNKIVMYICNRKLFFNTCITRFSLIRRESTRITSLTKQEQQTRIRKELQPKSKTTKRDNASETDPGPPSSFLQD